MTKCWSEWVATAVSDREICQLGRPTSFINILVNKRVCIQAYNKYLLAYHHQRNSLLR